MHLNLQVKIFQRLFRHSLGTRELQPDYIFHYVYQKGDYESMSKDAFEFAGKNISTVIRTLAGYKRTST